MCQRRRGDGGPKLVRRPRVVRQYGNRHRPVLPPVTVLLGRSQLPVTVAERRVTFVGR